VGGRLSRRELVFAGALAAAGGGVVLGFPARAAAASPDLDAVLGAVRLEQALAVAYAALAETPGIGRDLRDLLVLLADQERQHAAGLLTLAEYLGAPPPPVPSITQVEAALPNVRRAVDRATTLAVVDELERAEVLGFSSDQQVLTDAKLIQMVGAVMCGDAQHLVLVREAAGIDPIPMAFETGKTR
jgi:hypothetical protein